MNMKQTTLITIIMVALALTFTTCKHEEDGPKNQSATINPFEDYKVTVKGTFTDTEWKGSGASSVAGKIENAMKSHFEGAPDFGKDALRPRYAKCKIVFVEKTSDYNNWKTTGDGETICINYNVLNTEDLKNSIIAALISMEASKTEQG